MGVIMAGKEAGVAPSPVGLVLNTGDNDHSVHGRQCFVSSHAGLAESRDFPCFAGEETEAQRKLTVER